jgi:putative NADH-flavin reductase
VVTADLAAPDPSVLESEVPGADAVLSGFGPRSAADAGITAPGTKAVVRAMQATGVRRVVVVGAAPVSMVRPPGRPNRHGTTPAAERQLLDGVGAGR